MNELVIRVGLLIPVVLIGYRQAVYMQRYVASSPSRRDVTHPTEDLSWRTTRQLALSLTLLIATAGLAIFIFTHAATQFARSPIFWPIVMAGLGLFAAYETLKGLVSGNVEPVIRGDFGPFRRRERPMPYWLSILWNASMAAGLMIGAFAMDWTH